MFSSVVRTDVDAQETRQSRQVLRKGWVKRVWEIVGYMNQLKETQLLRNPGQGIKGTTPFRMLILCRMTDFDWRFLKATSRWMVARQQV